MENTTTWNGIELVLTLSLFPSRALQPRLRAIQRVAGRTEAQTEWGSGDTRCFWLEGWKGKTSRALAECGRGNPIFSCSLVGNLMGRMVARGEENETPPRPRTRREVSFLSPAVPQLQEVRAETRLLFTALSVSCRLDVARSWKWVISGESWGTRTYWGGHRREEHASDTVELFMNSCVYHLHTWI